MKGFVFVWGGNIVLRFLENGSFQELERRHDITYVVFEVGDLRGRALSLIGEGRRIEWVPFYPGRFSRWEELFNISCILNRDKSSSFAIRYQEMAQKQPEKYRRYEELATQEVYGRHRDAVERAMGLNPALLELTLREKPGFFVLPSGLMDYATDDVMQIAVELGIPTLVLVMAWDNLSSKGLLYHKPTMLGVWGEQSKKHAIEIQGIPADRVRLMGAPQYDRSAIPVVADRAATRARWGLPRDGLIVLFAGTFRLFDETRLLEDIDRAVAEQQLPPMHIVYRPHPWRMTRPHEDDFYDRAWGHVSMDPEMADAYTRAKRGGAFINADNFVFDMRHLFELYQIVDAVITPCPPCSSSPCCSATPR